MRLSAVTSLATLTACGFHLGANVPVDGAVHDDGTIAIDAPEVSHDAQACFGPVGWSACFTPVVPTGPVTLGPAISTDLGSPDCSPAPASWTGAGQPDACFIAGTSVLASGTVMVTGARPLVLVGTDSITVMALLDVASHRGGPDGAGHNSPACSPPGVMPANGTAGHGGGGGAGGSLGTVGGNGGKGNQGNSNAGTAGTPLTAIAMLAGGCAGQQGGDGDGQNTNHGVAGNGGGAVYLLAGTSITIASSGTINASGAAGKAAGRFGGGAGGGSGGMIVLFAPAITVTGARLLANGGGGSGGGYNNGSGIDGMDPNPGSPSAPAPGGGAPGSQRSGGAGFAQGSAAARGIDGNAQDDAGGGGGGGGGYIRASSPLAGAIAVSPTAVILP